MSKKRRRRVFLWDLFRPVAEQPAWSSLPVEVRQKVTRLLARLLLGTAPTCHRGASKEAASKEAASNGVASKEVGDE